MTRTRIRKDSLMNVCQNYDDIVNYVYREDDMMTRMFIEYYRDMMDSINLNDSEEVEMVFEYDQALYSYLTNRKFYYLVQEKYNMKDDWGNFIMNNLVHLYHLFINLVLVEPSKSRWL